MGKLRLKVKMMRSIILKKKPVKKKTMNLLLKVKFESPEEYLTYRQRKKAMNSVRKSSIHVVSSMGGSAV